MVSFKIVVHRINNQVKERKKYEKWVCFHNCRLLYQIYYFFHSLIQKASNKKICALKKLIWHQPVFWGQKTLKICDSKQFAIMQNYLYTKFQPSTMAWTGQNV